jgi:hypothetical protein
VPGTLADLSALIAGAPLQGQSSLEVDPFASHLVGEWIGEGVYEGNRLELARTWTLELGSVFLRADMTVSMPNGSSFGALMFWKSDEVGSYQVIWLDGIGRMQQLEAGAVPGSSIVRSEFVDDLAEGGPETRRWEYQRAGPDSYVERLLA